MARRDTGTGVAGHSRRAGGFSLTRRFSGIAWAVRTALPGATASRSPLMSAHEAPADRGGGITRTAARLYAEVAGWLLASVATIWLCVPGGATGFTPWWLALIGVAIAGFGFGVLVSGRNRLIWQIVLALVGSTALAVWTASAPSCADCLIPQRIGALLEFVLVLPAAAAGLLLGALARPNAGSFPASTRRQLGSPPSLFSIQNRRRRL